MINSMFLIDQTDDMNKKFYNLSAPKISNSKISKSDRFTINKQIIIKSVNPNAFHITKGQVKLNEKNQIYCLEHIQGNVDIVLPKADNIFDWIVLFYDQDRIVKNVSNERHSRIKLYGNGSRIMGLDEPMICDVPFMSLRLTYVNDIDGWIIT